MTEYRLIPIPGVELTPACPFCDGAHPLARCTAFAAETGAPLIGRLREENAALRAELDDAHQHIGALLGAITDLIVFGQATVVELYDPESESINTATDCLEASVKQGRLISSSARAWLRRGAR